MLDSVVRGRILRTTLGYALLVGIPAAITLWVLAQAPDTSAAARVATPPKASAFSVGLLLAQLLAILVVASVAGRVARALRQPAVVGEMAAGILLGPSLLGFVAPTVSAALFPAESLAWLGALSQLGLVLFLFLVGLETDLRRLVGHADTALVASHSSIVVPFVLGIGLAVPLTARYGAPGVPFAHTALFLGAAMSVTAFPVLARILEERRLIGTPMGALAMSCAAVDDVTAWTLLAAVTALVRGDASGGSGALQAIVLTAAFAWLMLTLGRRAMQPLAARVAARGVRREDAAIIVLVALGAALATEMIGVHPLFGAFLAGLAMPKKPAFVDAIRERFADLTGVVLVPLVFAVTGLRTRLDLLADAAAWGWAAAVFAVAVMGKLGGTWLGARWSGYPSRDAATLGALMNARGLMELVFLGVGLELGVLSPTLFTMMVLMALGTTLMTGPLLDRLAPTSEPRESTTLVAA
jgi:Kef-type K+ transport system membrane component KefB